MAEQQAVLKATMTSIGKYGLIDSVLSITERLMAIVLHTALSVFVFRAVREKGKGFLFPVAILLHMLFDVPAAMFQAGILNIYGCEVLLILFTVVIAFFAVRLYKNMHVDVEMPQ